MCKFFFCNAVPLQAIPTSPMLDLDDVEEIIQTVDSTGQTVEDVVNASFHLSFQEEIPEVVQPEDPEQQHLKSPATVADNLRKITFKLLCDTKFVCKHKQTHIVLFGYVDCVSRNICMQFEFIHLKIVSCRCHLGFSLPVRFKNSHISEAS
jgi:hypothetical protein